MAKRRTTRIPFLLAQVALVAALYPGSVSAQAVTSFFYTGPQMVPTGNALGSFAQITGEFRFSEPLLPGETVRGSDTRLIYARVLAGGLGGINDPSSGRYVLGALTVGANGLPTTWYFDYSWYSSFGRYTIVSYKTTTGGSLDEVLYYTGNGTLVGAASNTAGVGAWTMSQSVPVIPEPSTLALWGAGGLFGVGLSLRRRLQRAAQI